jgi:hypothetical protein
VGSLFQGKRVPLFSDKDKDNLFIVSVIVIGVKNSKMSPKTHLTVKRTSELHRPS